MATFTISLSGSTVVNGSKSWTLTDADVQTLIDYMSKKYGTGIRPGPVTPLTPAQALLAWAQGFVSSTISEIQRNKLEAAKAAVTVAPVSFT